MTLPVPFPAEREVDVVLRTGATVHIRPVRPVDRTALAAFFRGLSAESRATRFFCAGVNVDRVADLIADVDYEDAYGILALKRGEIVAHAGWVREAPARAEVAFAVADVLQGQGLATVLLAHLAEAAEHAGIGTLTAEVLPSNHRMADVFRESGFIVTVRPSRGVLEISMPAVIDADGRARFAARERKAAAASVARVLRPASVAVVGASERLGSVGGAVLQNLLAAGFAGEVSVVHPRARSVHGVSAGRRLAQLPAPPELAVVAVPAERVLDVARDAAEAGVGALVVLSAGFGESGEPGARRQDELLAICRDSGMRLVGPNCLGVLNTDPAIRLDATFAPERPRAGRIGFMSQSGALGIAAIAAARRAGVGLSSFVSVGNKADLSGNDLLQFWEEDPLTDVVLLYLESFGNPRKFARIAREVARTKPVAVVRAGRSAAGARAAASHTGALLSASPADVDAVFRHAGVIRTDTLGELFDVAALLDRQPAPAGRRLGIVTNGGGLGILCADAAAASGLEVNAASEATRNRLRSLVPAGAAVTNPVDLTATASPRAFGAAIRELARSGEVDAVVALWVPTFGTEAEAYGEAIRQAAADAPATVPVAAVFTATPPPRATGRDLPVYELPEQAARAVARAADYGVWRERDPAPLPRPDGIDADAAAALLARALGRGDGWLRAADALELARAYGIPVIDGEEALTPDAAAGRAAARATPVALKGVAPGLVHKTDAGAVLLGLEGADAVRAAAADMANRLSSQGFEPVTFRVEPMVEPGTEMLVGLTHDPELGPLVACAAGGTLAELTRDVAVRLAPLDRGDPEAMLDELAVAPLLRGFRGRPPGDVDALLDVVRRVAALAVAHPEVRELDLNPVVVTESGAVAVDARVRVAAAPRAIPTPSVQGD